MRRLLPMVRWRGLLVLAAAILAAIGMGHPAMLQAAELELGPGDKVAVSVHKRPDLSGEFRVLPAGTLSLPFIQSIPVAGRTLSDVKAIVVERLRDEAFILDPRVALDLIEVRPITVAGEVKRPGSYPYSLGMTVTHAVATAGGARTLDLESFTAFIEIGRLREKVRQNEEAVGLSRLRRLRLLAEQRDLPDIVPTAEIVRALGEERLRDALENEKRQRALRTDTFRSQMNVLSRQADVFEEEIRALTDQGSAKEREGVLIGQEVVHVEDLLRKGLVPRTSRLVELQRLAVQIEGEKRQIAASIAKAKQEIARVDQTRINLIGQRDLEITTSLKEADDNVSNLRISIEETRASLGEARDAVPGLSGTSRDPSGPDYTILRSRGQENVRITARADTALLPGDLIDVPRR